MPRKILIKTSEFPYHITNRSNNKEFFYLPLPELWDICLETLGVLEAQFGCRIHAFVLMSNHYHLLISTPRSNIGEAMKYFHREVARRANRKSSRTNHFFGGRYKWSVIYEDSYFWNALKYIFRNPVAAGVCSRVEEYAYSSLTSTSNIPSWTVVDIFKDSNDKVVLDLQWLNHTFSEDQAEGLSKALRRREFKLSANKSGAIVRFDDIGDVVRREKGTVT